MQQEYQGDNVMTCLGRFVYTRHFEKHAQHAFKQTTHIKEGGYNGNIIIAFDIHKIFINNNLLNLETPTKNALIDMCFIVNCE